MHTRQDVAVPAQPNHNLAPETFGEMVCRVLAKHNLSPKIDASHPEHIKAMAELGDPIAMHAIEGLRDLLATNWAPLEKLCPPGLCEQFMFMGTVGGVYLYKHIDSRRYLNVDVFGATYAYNFKTSSYDPISITAAMKLLVRP